VTARRATTLQSARQGLLVEPQSFATEEIGLRGDQMLPPLASPSGTLAHYGYVYHGLGGGLILLIAALNLRINLTAYVFSLVASVRRRARRTTPEAQKRTYRDGA
jgi:hypothetical protein